MQKIVAIDIAVFPLSHKRLIIPRLGLAQYFGGSQCRSSIHFAYRVTLFGKGRMVGIDTVKHSGIDGTKSYILGLFLLLAQALNSKLQRVRGYLVLHLCPKERSPQQLAVSLLLLCFLLNRRQMRNGSLREILPQSRLHFSP